MATEYATLSENLDETIGRQQANADADTALTAGGMILLWPLLIGLAFTPDEEEEISLMMGQAEALEASMEAADCPVQVVDPEETVVVDGQEVLVEEEQPVLVDGREPVGLFEGTPYEPDDQGQADGELEPDS